MEIVFFFFSPFSFFLFFSGDLVQELWGAVPCTPLPVRCKLTGLELALELIYMLAML
jgi:hypothetical protein